VKSAADSVLDSFALLAYLEDEAGAGEVQQLLGAADRGELHLWMSIVNLGEVLYIIERERSLEDAQRALAIIDELPIEVTDADRSLTFAAAHIKARHALSYADAFAVALAERVGGAVVTGDPEFRQVESLVAVHWLPQRSG
jgi:ribonuclease VapC